MYFKLFDLETFFDVRDLSFHIHMSLFLVLSIWINIYLGKISKYNFHNTHIIDIDCL